MFAKKEAGKIYQVSKVLHTMLKGKLVFILKTDEGDLVIEGHLYNELDRQLKAGHELSCIGKPVIFYKVPYKDRNGFMKEYWDMEIVKPDRVYPHLT